MKRISACTLDCPDTCSFVLEETIEGLSVRGNPRHPFTRGFICSKGAGLPKRLNSPDRITSPMLRKGDGHVEISWDEALDLCAAKLDALRDSPQQILHARGFGYRGVLAGASKMFFGSLGAANTYGSLCDNAGCTAIEKDFGALRQNNALQLAEAEIVVNWGKDLSRSSVHTAVLVRTARKNGATVVSISPGGDGNSDYSDKSISIRPGTDRFLALATLKILADTDRLHPAARTSVANLDGVMNMLDGGDLHHWLDQCGVAEHEARQLADLYASGRAVASLVGWGLQRHVFGGQNLRAINALALLSGQMCRPAAGVYYNVSSSRAFARAAKPDFQLSRSFFLPDLAAELERADPPVELCWVDGTNVVNQVPDSGRMARVFSAIPFTVCVDAFFNDTTRRADLILPCALTMEREDIVGSCLHSWVNHSAKQLDPPGTARCDYDILTDLAARLRQPVRLPEPREWMRQALADMGVSLDELREQGFARIPEPDVAWEGMAFDHADGKARLLDEVNQEPRPDGDWPLHLLSLVRRTYVHSQIPEEKQQGLPTVFVSPRCPHLPDTDLPVHLTTPLGRLPVRVETDASLRPDVVVMRRGGWLAHGWNPNALIEPRATDMGDGAALYAQHCRLEN